MEAKTLISRERSREDERQVNILITAEGERWNPSRRFGELKKAIPLVTNTMPTSTLRDLERIGIVNRQQFNEIPPHVEYSLTESGKALLPVFFEIAKWSESYMSDEDK